MPVTQFMRACPQLARLVEVKKKAPSFKLSAFH